MYSPTQHQSIESIGEEHHPCRDGHCEEMCQSKGGPGLSTCPVMLWARLSYVEVYVWYIGQQGEKWITLRKTEDWSIAYYILNDGWNRWRYGLQLLWKDENWKYEVVF